MKNQIVWVDIPVIILDRAINFYTALLGQTIHKETINNLSFGVLPHTDTDVSGCLYLSDDNRPSVQGPLIYLNVNERMDEAMGATERNGGKILNPKQPIGPHGFRTIILDSEGNRIALHSTSDTT